MSLFHEQYNAGGDPVLFRCRECGHLSLSLGSLHAHIEKHRGFTRFNLQLPFTKTSPGDFKRLMDKTEVLRVTDTVATTLSEVDGL
jgi:hypothetical protein